MILNIKDREAYEIGRLDAERDVASGRLLIKLHGRPIHWVPAWKDILKADYGVEVILGGCRVDDKTQSYEVGYNEVSEAEMRKRFGPDALESAVERAKALTPGDSFITYPPVGNDNPEIEASINPHGWVKCPNCGISFKITSSQSWDGRVHLSCQQKLRISPRPV
jgi:hypothetical protein